MKQYPQAGDPIHRLNEMAALRREDIREYEVLRDSKLKGRQRTGVRAVPTGHNDVTANDFEGDKLNDGTYKYELINDSGTLKWRRETMDISW